MLYHVTFWDCELVLPYVFFLFLIFFIQYSGWTDPTNGQGHEI